MSGAILRSQCDSKAVVSQNSSIHAQREEKARQRACTAKLASELGLLDFMQSLAKHTGSFESVAIYKGGQLVAKYRG